MNKKIMMLGLGLLVVFGVRAGHFEDDPIIGPTEGLSPEEQQELFDAAVAAQQERAAMAAQSRSEGMDSLTEGPSGSRRQEQAEAPRAAQAATAGRSGRSMYDDNPLIGDVSGLTQNDQQRLSEAAVAAQRARRVNDPRLVRRNSGSSRLFSTKR